MITRTDQGYVTESEGSVGAQNLPAATLRLLKKTGFIHRVRDITHNSEWGDLGFQVTIAVDGIQPETLKVFAEAGVTLYAVGKGKFAFTSG